MYLTSEVSANMWYKSRLEAAQTNPRLGSREGLAEETGISRNRIVRIEAGTDMPTPDEARLIAMACNKPEIQQYYCRVSRQVDNQGDELHGQSGGGKRTAVIRDG